MQLIGIQIYIKKVTFSWIQLRKICVHPGVRTFITSVKIDISF